MGKIQKAQRFSQMNIIFITNGVARVVVTQSQKKRKKGFVRNILFSVKARFKKS